MSETGPAYQPNEREQVLLAAITGANASPNWLTSDMVDALLGGHGMLNIAVINIADVLVNELKRGIDTKLRFANAAAQPVDEVLAKAIKAAVQAGAAPANAALLSAVMMYLTGTKAQVGIPAGNRKLGASARMLAGVDRSGVAAIPTSKKNNKVSGFAAVMAVHQAMMEGKLSPVSGYDMAVSGGPLIGHSRLGEDIIFPAMAVNGARIGTQAMMDCMAGAGIKPQALNAAVFGAAAILEIIHPDADIAEEYGPHGKVTTAFLAGKTAAETAGLPEKLTVRITGQEYQTGQVIGDLGLILKDIGGPSVIGIMAMDEIMGVFAEGIAGSSAGPVNPPLGHVCTDAVIAMKCLLEPDATPESVAVDPARTPLRLRLRSRDFDDRDEHRREEGPAAESRRSDQRHGAGFGTGARAGAVPPRGAGLRRVQSGQITRRRRALPRRGPQVTRRGAGQRVPEQDDWQGRANPSHPHRSRRAAHEQACQRMVRVRRPPRRRGHGRRRDHRARTLLRPDHPRRRPRQARRHRLGRTHWWFRWRARSCSPPTSSLTSPYPPPWPRRWACTVRRKPDSSRSAPASSPPASPVSNVNAEAAARVALSVMAVP